jgi:hypothetical protein
MPKHLGGIEIKFGRKNVISADFKILDRYPIIPPTCVGEYDRWTPFVLHESCKADTEISDKQWRYITLLEGKTGECFYGTSIAEAKQYIDMCKAKYKV